MKGSAITKPFSYHHLSTRTITYIVYGCVFALFYAYHTYITWHYTVDDAFITLRYAEHLTQGKGLVWNIDGVHIEGYSNFLYVLIGALAIQMHLPAILVLKLVSTIAVCLSCLGLYYLAGLWLPKPYRFLPALVLLMHPGEIIWGVSGLETPLYQSLLIFATYYLLKSLNADNTSHIRDCCISGVLLSVSSYTRPEGPMIVLCYSLLLIWYHKTYLQKALWSFILSFSILYLPYFGWRLFYFGRFFPNTVYCKAMNAPSGPWELDLNYLILIFPLCFLMIPAFKWAYDRRYMFLVAPSVCYLIVLYQADWIVGFLERHFLGALALLLPLYVIGIHRFFSLPSLNLSRMLQHLLCVTVSLVGGYLFLGQHYTNYEYHYIAESTRQGNQLRADVAKWLTQNLKKSDSISLGDCGLIPYLYRGHVIDSYCLNNAEMTKQPIYYSYNRFNQWLLTQKKPNYIILLALLGANKAYYPPSDLGLLHHPMFHQHYKELKRFMMGTTQGGYQYVIYRQKSSYHPVSK